MESGSPNPWGQPILGSVAPQPPLAGRLCAGSGSGLLVLGPMFPFLYLFKVFSWPFLCYLHTCPPANEQSPKFLELLVTIPNTKFGVCMSGFYVRFGD
jgi:hypothetical protein